MWVEKTTCQSVIDRRLSTKSAPMLRHALPKRRLSGARGGAYRLQAQVIAASVPFFCCAFGA